MRYSLRPVGFVDLALSGEVTEASVGLGHLLGRFITVEDVTGHLRASFEQNDANGDLYITLSNGNWAVLEPVNAFGLKVKAQNIPF